MKCITEVHDREEVSSVLKVLSDEGYRYLVRDKDSDWLSCYSLKPKKYRDLETWGYVDSEVPGAMMAYIFRNHDIIEVNWTNRSAKPITDFLEK